MTTNTDSTAPLPPPALPPAPARPPLRRSSSDKVIAGVCGGIARWLGIDPVIVRVVLVVLAVFGGSGLVLYLIGWLFIPMEGESTSSADAFFRDASRTGSTARTVLVVIGVVVAVILGLNLIGWAFGSWGGGGSVLLLLGVGALVLYLVSRSPQPSMAPPADEVASAAAEPTAYAYGGSGQYPGYVATMPVPPTPQPPRQRSYLGLITLSIAVIVTGVLLSFQATGLTDLPPVVIPAIALAILGAGLLVGAWLGRARWLLWFAIPTLIVTIAASYVPANIDGLRTSVTGGVGERVWAPTTVEAAEQDFELGIGSARLDLTRLVLPADADTVEVAAEVGLGELVVVVPDNARVLVDADVELGELLIDGVPRTTDDPSPSFEGALPGGSDLGPVIDLSLSTTLGSLEVSRA